MTSKLKRLKDELAAAVNELQRQKICGNVVALPRLIRRIETLKEKVQIAESYEPRRLADMITTEVLNREHLSEKIVKLHIAADFLSDCAFDLRSTLRRIDLEACSLFPPVDNIEKIAADFAGMVCHPEFAGLSDFMTTNERLIDDLHLIIDRYMSQHLKIK